MKVNWIVAEMCLPFSTFQSLKGRWKSHFSKKLKCGVSSYGRRKLLIVSSWIFTPFRFYLLFRKRVGPSFQQKWISFTQGCIVPSCGWNSPSDSGEDFCVVFFFNFFYNFLKCIFAIFLLSPLWKGCGPSFKQTVYDADDDDYDHNDDGQRTICDNKKKLTWAFVSGELK